MDPEARIAIWHGRIGIPREGLDILIEAWRRVTAARPALNLHLLLVGNGMDSSRFAALLEANPLPTFRWISDYVTDRRLMARMLSAADLYVMASRVEGFPVAPHGRAALCPDYGRRGTRSLPERTQRHGTDRPLIAS